MKRAPAVLLLFALVGLPSLAGAGEVIDAATFADRCSDGLTVTDELVVSGGFASIGSECGVELEEGSILRIEGVTLSGTCCGLTVVGEADSRLEIAASTLSFPGAVALTPGCCPGPGVPMASSTEVHVSGSSIQGETVAIAASEIGRDGVVRVEDSSITATTDEVAFPVSIASAVIAGGRADGGGGEILVTSSTITSPTGIRVESGRGGRTEVSGSTLSGEPMVAAGYSGECVVSANEPVAACTEREPHVVVATLDTGTNPFHPTWRRDQFRHPASFIPGYPISARPVELTFTSSFTGSVNASTIALNRFKEDDYPKWIPGTNLIGAWAKASDTLPIFQKGSTSHSHGAQASSQIAGTEFGMAPETWVVIMDRTDDPATNAKVYTANAEGLRWAAQQPWIDIIHTNIQHIAPLAGNPTPVDDPDHEAVFDPIAAGKLVVSAGGNWYAESTETSPHAGPAGVLAAGANDNCGYTEFSNPNPHVVMDGASTVSAEPSGFGTASFGGTSSGSPRTTGYAAKLLLEIRRAFGYTDGMHDGALVLLDNETPRPAQGPLADGRLTAAELHEVIRKTANPNPHPSMWDGAQGTCIPQPADYPVAFYPKMGYGEVSEHTIGQALAVAIGQAPMPARPVEDMFYAASEQARHTFWD